jgi:hypothetical protein
MDTDDSDVPLMQTGAAAEEVGAGEVDGGVFGVMGWFPSLSAELKTACLLKMSSTQVW